MEPAYSLEFGAAAGLGTRYAVNQDHYHVDPELGIFIVADGVGGGPAGEVASKVAVNASYAFLNRVSTRNTGLIPEKQIESAVHQAGQALLAMIAQVPSLQGMGATLLIAWLPGNRRRLWLAHVGDCRCYVLRHENLNLLTHDHTVLNAVRDAGKLPDDPADWPPRHILSQALGSAERLAPQILSRPVNINDLFLLCSDGVYDPLGEEHLQQILSQPAHPQDQCDGLIQAVNTAGGEDNSTAIIVRVTDSSLAETRVANSLAIAEMES